MDNQSLTQSSDYISPYGVYYAHLKCRVCYEELFTSYESAAWWEQRRNYLCYSCRREYSPYYLKIYLHG